jgi:hypothetical protein
MRKNLLFTSRICQITIFLLSFAIVSGSKTTASAADFLVGAKAGYFIWDPYFKHINSMYGSMKNGDGVLYGPILSGSVSDFTLSFSGLFGSQSSHWLEKSFAFPGSSNKTETANFTFDNDRIDLDSALSYRITDYFRIIAGYKYQYLSGKLEFVDFGVDNTGTLTSSSVMKAKMTQQNQGPAAGIGFSVPFGERFFFATNVSAIYMFGTFKTTYSYYGYSPTYNVNNMPKNNFNVRMLGTNLEPSIGASLGENLPIVTLGVRFQWAEYKFINPPENTTNSHWNNDYIYGVFVSTVYRI